MGVGNSNYNRSFTVEITLRRSVRNSSSSKSKPSPEFRVKVTSISNITHSPREHPSISSKSYDRALGTRSCIIAIKESNWLFIYLPCLTKINERIICIGIRKNLSISSFNNSFTIVPKEFFIFGSC